MAKQFFFAFSFSLLALAQARTYKVSDYELRRYILPQVRSLVQDYYSFISIIQENKKIPNSLYRELPSLKKLAKSIKNTCITSEQSPYCQNKLIELAVQLAEFQKSKDKAMANVECAAKAQDRCLELLQSNAQLEAYSHQVYHRALSLRVGAPYNSLNSMLEFEKSLERQLLLADLWLADSVTSSYGDEVHLVLSNFILPLEKWMLYQNDSEFLKLAYHELSGVWNHFSIQMRKRIDGVPKRAKILVNTMANRWNSIMKVALR